MATTLTIRNSMNFILPILKMQPLEVTGQEPALTAGNLILQTILAPPCRWPFNRNTFSFATVVTTPPTVDYTLALPDFRFLETQWLVDAAGTIHQVTGKIALAKSSNKGRPTELAVQFDDNAGNITFRVKDAPNAIYTIEGDYQKKAALLDSDARTWGVVPDEFSVVFNFGFLCLLSLLINDSRFPIFERWFIGRLLSVQDGLTDQERNIFLANWANSLTTMARSQGQVQAGTAGRGL